MSIYPDYGYSNRKDYLFDLADQYGIDVDVVLEMASILVRQKILMG